MLPLGTQAPDFELPNVDGRMVTLGEVAGARGTVVMFICNHCPFVKHVRAEFARFAREYQPRGLGVADLLIRHRQVALLLLRQAPQKPEPKHG